MPTPAHSSRAGSAAGSKRYRSPARKGSRISSRCWAQPAQGTCARPPCSFRIRGSRLPRSGSAFAESSSPGAATIVLSRRWRLFLLEYDRFRSVIHPHGRQRPACLRNPATVQASRVARFARGGRIGPALIDSGVAVVRQPRPDERLAGGSRAPRARQRGRQPRRALRSEAGAGGDARDAGEARAAGTQARRIAEPSGRARGALPGPVAQPRRMGARRDRADPHHRLATAAARGKRPGRVGGAADGRCAPRALGAPAVRSPAQGFRPRYGTHEDRAPSGYFGVCGKARPDDRERGFAAARAGRASRGGRGQRARGGGILGAARGGAARRIEAARPDTEGRRRRSRIAQPVAGLFPARELEAAPARRASFAPRARRGGLPERLETRCKLARALLRHAFRDGRGGGGDVEAARRRRRGRLASDDRREPCGGARLQAVAGAGCAMKGLLWLLAAFALAVALALALRANDGYALFVLHPWRTEISLNLLAVLLIVAFAAGYFLVRMVWHTLRLPSHVRAFRERRRDERGRAAVLGALQALVEGRCARTEERASRPMISVRRGVLRAFLPRARRSGCANSGGATSGSSG